MQKVACNLILKLASLIYDSDRQMLEELRRERGNHVAIKQTDQPKLSREAVKSAVQKTYAVKTSTPEKLAVWKSQLQKTRMDFANHNWRYEVDFADALLEILDDTLITLDDINPYARAFGKMFAAIVKFHRDHSDSTIDQNTLPAKLFTKLGKGLSSQGEQQQAIIAFDLALKHFRMTRDSANEAATLNSIGLAWFALGEQREALGYYEKAYSVSRSVRDRSMEAQSLNNIGAALITMGEARKALKYMEKALPLIQVVGDKEFEGNLLYNVGSALYALGDRAKALSYFTLALPIFHGLDRQI